MKVFDNLVKLCCLGALLQQVEINLDVWGRTQTAHLGGNKNLQKKLEFDEEIEKTKVQFSLKKV